MGLRRLLEERQISIPKRGRWQPVLCQLCDSQRPYKRTETVGWKPLALWKCKLCELILCDDCRRIHRVECTDNEQSISICTECGHDLYNHEGSPRCRFVKGHSMKQCSCTTFSE